MKLAQKQGRSNKTGAYGEAIALRFMRNKGFELIDQNYSKKWGEIDLILQKGVSVHFIEVKSVSHETRERISTQEYGYRPEEQLTGEKYKKLARTIETWVSEQHYKGQYQLDLITVHMVPRETYAQVEYFGKITVE